MKVNATLAEAIHGDAFLYPSNIVTLARIGLLLPIGWYAYQPQKQSQALFYMGVSMLTDIIDGPLARARGEVSSVGQMLDPIADKLTLNVIAVILSLRHSLPWWITGLFIIRDVGILLSALHFYHKKAHFIPSQHAGKLTTFTLTTATILHLAQHRTMARIAFYVALATGVASVWQYGSDFAHHINTQHDTQTIEHYA